MSEIYLECGGELRALPTLGEALLPKQGVTGPVSFVGAGGKSTLIYELADELAARGKRVIVTTTTHMFFPRDRKVVLVRRGGRPDAYSWPLSAPPPDRVLVVGADIKGEKLTGLSPEAVDGLSAYGDAVLVEADGAKRMPLKVPEDWEPVLPFSSRLVIACAGLDCLRKPLCQVCFRWEKAEELLKMTGEEPVGPEELAVILTSRQGARKSAGGREYRIVLNKADSDEAVRLALRTIEKIRGKKGGSGVPCVVSSFLRGR